MPIGIPLVLANARLFYMKRIIGGMAIKKSITQGCMPVGPMLQSALVLVAVAVYAWFGINVAMNPALMNDPVYSVVMMVWGVSLVALAIVYAYRRMK